MRPANRSDVLDDDNEDPRSPLAGKVDTKGFHQS